MKYFEFQATVTEDGMLPLPKDVVASIGSYRTVHVTLVADESEEEEDEAWRLLGVEAFLRDDGPEDHLYDELANLDDRPGQQAPPSPPQ